MVDQNLTNEIRQQVRQRTLAVCRGEYGRYWARTSDPQLVDWGDRSRPFAQVRSTPMVQRNPTCDRTPERTRTNADPCHPCHARSLCCPCGAFNLLVLMLR